MRILMHRFDHRARRLGLWTSRIDLNLAQVPHRLSPQFLEALRQIVRELTVAYEERREPAFLYEWMVQREHDGVIVHDMKRVTEFPRVADAGHLSQIVPMRFEELEEMSGAPVRKAEDHAMLDAVLGRVLGDAPEDREPVLDGLVDRHEIAGFHV